MRSIVAGILILAASSAQATAYQFEAEHAEAVHSEVTGTYAKPAEGGYVEWLLRLDQPIATQLINVRYANGSSGARMAITVNGTSSTLVFPPTASWKTWNRLAIVAALNAGLNTIRIGPAGSRTVALDRLVLNSAVTITSMDWGQALIVSTLARWPDPAQLTEGLNGQRWRYPQGLFALGMYRAGQREPARMPGYLAYITAWLDARTAPDGSITKTVDPNLAFLDTIMPGRIALAAWQETGAERYKLTADRLMAGLAVHKRTPTGVWWHSNNQRDMILADGSYMGLPFAVDYDIGNAADAATQLKATYSHLIDPATGLLFHAFDLQGDGKTGGLDWTTGTNTRSNVIWGRAIGWYLMAVVDVLDRAPHAELVGILQSLATALTAVQDTSGLWWTVPAHPMAVRDNFLETSASAMFVYALSKGIAAGWLDPSFVSVAAAGYAGVMRRVRVDAGLASIDGTAHGQEVQLDTLTEVRPTGAELYTTTRNVNGAFSRLENGITNDLHGIGAFLLMHDQVQRNHLW